MKPIPFNPEMVKAILDGRKTQTRRIIKIKNKLTRDWAENTGVEWIKLDLTDEKYPYSIREQNGAWNDYSLKDFIKKYSQYKVGDILYVREPTKVMSPPVETCKKLTFKYLADNKITEIYLDDDFDYSKKWIQRCQGVPNGCIKEMARIFLKVTNAGVERLQDILVGDIIAEGYYNPDCTNHSRPHYFAEMAKNGGLIFGTQLQKMATSGKTILMYLFMNLKELKTKIWRG